MFISGVTTIGLGANQDIQLSGDGVELKHCRIENNRDLITIYPVDRAPVYVDGELLSKPVILSQGIFSLQKLSSLAECANNVHSRLFQIVSRGSLDIS